MLKTILFLISILLLSSCTSTKDEKTLVEAPRLINLVTSTTKQKLQVQIKTLADVSIYLNDKYITKSDENGDASIELKLDTSTSFNHFTLKVKQEDTFSKVISFSVEYIKEEKTQEGETSTDQNQTQDDKTNTDKNQDDKTNTDQNQTQDDTTNTDQNKTITNPSTTPTKELIALEFQTNTIELKEGDTTLVQVFARYRDNSQEDISSKVQWIIPNTQEVEIQQARLKALKEGLLSITARYNNISTTKALNIRIYKEINGHKLPPEPNKTLNDSTLLGIDVNNNGVRDDVERWIYETYKDKHPIHIDIAMQAGRAWQKVLEDPTKAIEIHDYIRAPRHCESYYKNYAIYSNESILVDKSINNKYFIKNIIYNTEERSVAYLKYDSLLSGGMYILPKIGTRKQFCDFNTSKYEK